MILSAYYGLYNKNTSRWSKPDALGTSPIHFKRDIMILYANCGPDRICTHVYITGIHYKCSTESQQRQSNSVGGKGFLLVPVSLLCFPSPASKRAVSFHLCNKLLSPTSLHTLQSAKFTTLILLALPLMGTWQPLGLLGCSLIRNQYIKSFVLQS